MPKRSKDWRSATKQRKRQAYAERMASHAFPEPVDSAGQVEEGLTLFGRQAKRHALTTGHSRGFLHMIPASSAPFSHARLVEPSTRWVVLPSGKRR